MTTESPRSDHDGLSQAMANVDEIEHEEAQSEELVNGTEHAMQEALPPVFRTHSNAVRARLTADQYALQQIIADLDAKIAGLNAERTDAMLSYSAGEAAKRALGNGSAS